MNTMKNLNTCVFLALSVLYIAKKELTMPSMDLSASSDSLRAHVKYLSALDPPRSSQNPGSLEKARDYIEQKLAGMDLKPERQCFAAGGDSFANVLAVVNPQHRRILVIGAHYDVCGNTPGADDNASAVAGLLELARMVNRHRDSLDLQVVFAFYANEEPPYFGTELMGSWIHAKSLRDQSADVRLMLCLEMIGYYTEEKSSQRYPSSLLKPFYPSRGNFIAAVSDFGGRKFLRPIRKALNKRLPCRTLAGPRKLPGLGFSDHRNFWKAGYKAVMITDTAFFRNPNYHEAGDTPETLDYAKMASVVAGLAEYVLSGPI
jgi:hypothetical protein